MRSVEDRFLAMVKKTDSCWLWMGSKIQKGYGHFRFESGANKLMLTHRVSYLLYKGEIPEGMLVCHSCNNKGCVNPDHLYLGTNQQNMLDASRDGLLANRNYARGAKASHAKLTDDQVREIREKYGEIIQLGKKIKSANGVTMKELSQQYGITFAQINHLIHRHSYVDA